MEQEDLLAYNTQKKKLILPEYGRNVHRMIEYCMSLEDRDERTRCANAIVNICLLYTSPSPRDCS